MANGRRFERTATPRQDGGRATLTRERDVDVDVDRTAFAVTLLARCTEDLQPRERERLWTSYAEACAIEATGSGELAHSLDATVATVSRALIRASRWRGRELTRRRFEERIELGLELDASSTGRIRLARQLAAALMLTPTEEIATALTLAASADGPVASAPELELPPAVSLLDDDDLELDGFDVAVARLSDLDDL